ncbi:hypothetical protein PUR29_34750 [Methylobacterium ajmalii]|uniref:Uncharacterized protein n=1 Tax=Methylobacterium ajmalii TaxID=2738439 RepID=A0ABV0A5S4_9HYPH
MQSGFRPDDAERVLGHLRHGLELAAALKGERATTADAIWCLITEALETFDRMPDQERSWLTSGTRSGGWSSVGLTGAEARELERLRLLSAMKPYDGPSGRVIERSAGDRAFDVMLFLRWIGMYVATRRPVDQIVRATLALARGGDSEAFHRIWEGVTGKRVSRQAVSQFRTTIYGHVLAGLKRDLGIVPDGDAFRITHPEARA